MDFNDSKLIITLSGFLGSVLGALGITKFMLKKNDERITSLEANAASVINKDDCEKIRTACMERQEKFLERIEAGQQHLVERMELEFRQHNKLHLEIAKELGRLNGKKRNGDNT